MSNWRLRVANLNYELIPPVEIAGIAAAQLYQHLLHEQELPPNLETFLSKLERALFEVLSVQEMERLQRGGPLH